MTEVRGMKSEPSQQPQHSPPTVSAQSSTLPKRLIFLGLIAAAIAVGVGTLGTHPIDRAQEAISQALSDYTGYPAHIGRIRVTPPARAVLYDIEAGPFSAREVHLGFNLQGLLRQDPFKAIRRFSVVDGVYSIAGAGVPLSFHLQGEVVADGDELLLRLTRGLINAGDAWGVSGEARVVDGALAGASFVLSPSGGARGGSLELTVSPHAGAVFEIQITGADLPLPELWHGIAPLIPVASRESLSPPEAGRADVDMRVSLDREGVKAATGAAVFRGMRWEPFAFESAQIELRHQREGAATGAKESGQEPIATVATIEAGRGRAFHHQLLQVTGVVMGGPAGWSLTQTCAAGPGGADYSIEGELSSDGVAVLVIDGERVPIDEAVRWLPGVERLRVEKSYESPGDGLWALISDVTGVARGTVRVRSGERGWEVAGELDIGGAWIGNTRLAGGELLFSTGREGVALSGARRKSGAGESSPGRLRWARIRSRAS